jgi:hypothetical protein
MTIGTRAVTELKEPEGALLLNLGKFPGGPQSALERIPTGTSGVYAWFRSFDYSDNPDELFEQLMSDLRSPKFQERTGSIKPFYELTLRSQTWFSPGKMDSLKSAVHDPTFRTGLLATLKHSILLQAPLYIGKSIDLKNRIAAHLTEGSILCKRLADANVEMKRTLLFIIPNHLNGDLVDQDTESETGLDSSLKMDAETADETPYELIYEEIYSRLFNPLFTIRIG